jgi:hypothetical protein
LRGRALVAERFDWRTIAADLERLYAEILAQAAARVSEGTPRVAIPVRS